MKIYKTEIRSSDLDDAEQLSLTMREADVQEIWATSHITPLQALTAALHPSFNAQTLLINSKIVCMAGVGELSLLSDVAIPWMLSAEVLPKYGRAYLRISKQWVDEMSTKYSYMENYVDSRNEVAVKWVKWLGFTVEPAVPYGPDRVLFHKIYKVT